MVKRNSSLGPVAVIGARGFLGRRIATWLSEQGQKDIILIDYERPERVISGARYYKIDLTAPTADTMLLDVFKQEKIRRVIHLGQANRPSRRESEAHEREVIGTFHLLNAAAAASVEQIIAGSSTLVYGAHPLNPNYLAESAPFRASNSYAYVKDQVENEGLYARFRDKNPDCVVTVLRFAPLLGPTVRNYVTRYLDQRLTISLLGFDPLVQVLHEADALAALQQAITHDANCALNIVPPDVLPLSTLLYRAGKVNVPVAHPLAYPMVRSAWYAGLSPVPAEHLDYIRYLCCGDGTKAEETIGFVARHNCDYTVESYAGVQRLRKLSLD